MSASQRHRLAADVAAASHPSNELPTRFVKPTHTNMLVDVAKRLQRLQTRGARLRKDLKRNDADIRHVKRELRALTQQISKGE